MDTARKSWDLRKELAMVQAIRHVRLALCITDPNLPDNPIVFVNDAFSELTGYSEDEVIGQNCRFLQGDGTTAESVHTVRNIIANREVQTVEIVNYRKDGTEFLNALQLGPILDDDNNLIFYFGSQLDVSEKRAEESRVRELAKAEMLHRLKNISSVMMVITRMTTREATDPQALGDILMGRLRALSEAHFDTLSVDDGPPTSLADMSHDILCAVAPFEERQFDVTGGDTPLPRSLMTPVALALHELAINAAKHGAFSSETGRVSLNWVTSTDQNIETVDMTWTETGGPSVQKPDHVSGSLIIQKLVQSAGGEIVYDWRPDGLCVRLRLHAPV